MQQLVLILAFLHTVGAPEEAKQQMASLSGAKGNITYVVSSMTPKHLPQATEIWIDLSEQLTEPDPEYGMRRPFQLTSPVLTAWMPGDSAQRETQMLWPGTQAGQYRAHLLFAGSGFGMLRVDAKKPDGSAFAVILPLAVGAPKQKTTPSRVFPQGKNEPLVGHAQLGKITYNRECGCCHGRDVYQGGSKEDGEGRNAPRFHSATFMLSKNEEELRKSALLTTLDRADIVTYLAPYRPNLRNVEPAATRYVYRSYDIDDDMRAAVRRAIGKPSAMKTVELFALYKESDKPRVEDAEVVTKKTLPGIAPKTAQRVSEDARDLDTATPSFRVGFFAIVRGASKEPIEEVWMLLDNALKIKRLLARDELSRPRTTPSKDALAAFESSGGRDDSAIPKQDRVEKGDELAQQIAAAFIVTRAAAVQYEKDEADRAALP